MDARAVAELADPARRIGRRIEFHARIGSTNDRARKALATGDGDGLMVVADEQLAGRGRRGRTWVSPPGRNLMLSAGLRTELPARRGWEVGAAAALALLRATASLGDLWQKWPNDIVAADGRKVAGLLVEGTVSGDVLSDAVIGIGLNVNWRRADMPAEIAAAATSLADLAGHEVDRIALLAALRDALDDEVRALEAGSSPVDRYRAAAWLTGREVHIVLGARQVSGRVVDVADDGALLLDSDGGQVAVAFGEVVRVEAAAGVAG